MNAFITAWVVNSFSAPGKVLVDNEREFGSPLYLEAMVQYNIETYGTVVSSPWSNGTYERNHVVIDLVVEKILHEDPKIKIKVALANAANAK